MHHAGVWLHLIIETTTRNPTIVAQNAIQQQQQHIHNSLHLFSFSFSFSLSVRAMSVGNGPWIVLRRDTQHQNESPTKLEMSTESE
jgi:hypothetical protein